MADTDVKSLLLQIDASVELLKKNLQHGQGWLDEFEKKARANMTAVELAIEKAGIVAEGAAKQFETLRAGMEAIGLVLPALVLGEMAKKGLEFAAAIGEQAKQAGISAERLQELRYAATQTGVSQDALQTTLVRLQNNLGKAEDGSTSLRKAFEAIGISQADLKNHTATSTDAFDKLTNKMHDLGPSAQAAGLAWTLVGRSWAEAAPLLYAGSQRINELSDAAKQMGIVLSNEQIQHAEETAHKLKELELVLSAHVAGIVADNAGAIYRLASALASLAGNIARVDSQKLMAILGAVAGAQVGRMVGGGWGAAGGAVVGGAIGYGANAPASEYAARANQVQHQAQAWARMQGWDGDPHNIPASIKNHPTYQGYLKQFQMNVDAMHRAEGGSFAAEPDSGGGGGANLPDFLGGGGRKHHDDTADRLRDAENKSYEAAKQELSAKQQQLQAQEKLAIDIEDRQKISLDLVDNEHVQKALEIEHNLKLAELDPKITAAKKAELEASARKQLALNDQLTSLRRQEIYQQAELAREQQFEKFAQQELDAKTSYLQIQDGLAQTAAERRRIELEILEITYQEKKRALEAIQNATITDPETGVTKFAHNADERETARRDEATLERNHPLEVQQRLVSTAGPMEAFLRSLPDTAQKATEALQNVEVQGLQSISQGIVDVITGTKSLGQAFHDIANQIIADLLRIAVQKEIVGPLANMLFGTGGGGGGGGGGDFLSALGAGTGSMAGFAAGGDPPVGRVSLVGERGPELFVPKVPGTIIPNHALGGGGAAGAQVIYVAVDKSDLFDVQVRTEANKAIGDAAPALIGAAHQAVMRTVTRTRLNG